MIFLQNLAVGSRRLNGLFLILISVMLLGSPALYWLAGQVPPPLALLQQAAYVMAGIGLVLNMRLGPSPLHYAMVIISAIGGLAASAWMLLQGHAALRAPWGGLRADTWHFLACAALVLFAVVMQARDRKWGDNAMKKPVSLQTGIVMGVFSLAVLAQLADTGYRCRASNCLGTRVAVPAARTVTPAPGSGPAAPAAGAVPATGSQGG
ncbi:disulfide bond formation protein DsbB [Bordetella genomosp. 1]|uniref:Disulfide bond formation protein DsbB n=1 Tax=Bordetella genomosp. 1 TaxID=1395607 RepID=A0A261SXP6_9BORD|nr:hypothetical protein [Bordetella genomosp. 1]OZI41083.1 disulfide bond formation protein DsbB [Bordetella genomosp. 1]